MSNAEETVTNGLVQRIQLLTVGSPESFHNLRDKSNNSTKRSVPVLGMQFRDLQQSSDRSRDELIGHSPFYGQL